MKDQALFFRSIMLWDGQVEAISRNEEGKMVFQIAAPEASKVSYVIDGKEFFCEKDENGIWSSLFPEKNGFIYVQLKVDGVEMLTPLLPIGYGFSRPYNFVEIENDEETFYAIKNVPHGSVRREYFYSNTSGEWERCMVYTPPQYEEHSTKEFPVLYLQHGYGENENGWTFQGKVNFILDNLIDEKKTEPFVVVMCNGMTEKKDEKGNREIDFYRFEDLLLKDVMPYIESKYRVGKEKNMRALAGLSMGSFQTSLIGFKHPELFSSLGIFSGFITDFRFGRDVSMEEIVAKSSHLSVLEDADVFKKLYDVCFRAIGKEDQFYPKFEMEDKVLEDRGIEHVRKIYTGTHEWNVWRECIRDFAQLIFKK